MAEFAKAWSDCLPKSHREALYSALEIISDEFFEDALDDEEHIFRELLPSKYLKKYTPLFLKQFYTTLLTVGYKLSLPEKSSTLIACTAEELALRILIERASALLEEDGIDVDFGLFEDMIYQDIDFEYLYEPEMDGIEDSEAGVEFNIVNLHFSDWFKPFNNASMPVHPLCQNEAIDDDVDEPPK